MKVLVTGGAGYIGAHACERLARGGHVPITVDNLVYGHREAVKWGPLYEVDLLEQKKLLEIMNKEKIEAIMHFAAFAYVGESVENPLKYYHNNVTGGLSLIEATIKSKIRKFIFSSSCATYGIPEQLPLTETNPQNPVSPYGMTKLMLEHVLNDVTKATDLRAVSLRYFNASGAHADEGIGEDHDPETHLIPNVFRAITDEKFQLSVYGRDYETRDGSCVRDYIHVRDLADAHLLALEKIDSLADRHTKLNLGTGSGFSILEIIERAEAVTGRKVKWSFHARRPGDPAALVAESSQAKKLLGWETPASTLDAILGSAWKWHQRHQA